MEDREKDIWLSKLESKLELIVDRQLGRIVEAKLGAMLQSGTARVGQDLIIGLLRKGLEK